MDNIPENILNIPGDYQYKAMVSKNPFRSNWHFNKAVIVMDMVKDLIGKDILDIGAGSGNFEFLYHSNFNSIVALDYHKEASDFLAGLLEKHGISNVKVINKNLSEIVTSSEGQKYDGVLLLDVIEHIDNALVDKLLSDLRSVMSPGGKVIVSTPNYAGLWPLLERTVETLGLVAKMDGLQHVTKFNHESLTARFKSHGFKEIEVSTINTISFLLPLKSLSLALTRFEKKINIPFGNLLIAKFELD